MPHCKKDTLKLKAFADKRKIVECVNSVDPDEGAHKEPPHVDLHCLPPYL